MEATYESRCGACDRTIREGDEIEQVDGEWCHAGCASEEE